MQLDKTHNQILFESIGRISCVQTILCKYNIKNTVTSSFSKFELMVL